MTPTISCAADGPYTGMIVIRPHAARGRGVLLLNVADTENRIRYLDGFISASFFCDPDCAVVAEYVQWRTSACLDAAFRCPDFNEHLPIVALMAPHPEVCFYKVVHIAAPEPDAVAVDGPLVAMAIFTLADGAVGGRSALIDHIDRGVGSSDQISSAVLHFDPESGKYALLFQLRSGDFDAAGWLPQFTTLVEHSGVLEVYASVLASEERAGRLRYSLECA